jgi:dihydroorotate dehydrogenase (fumarate)
VAIKLSPFYSSLAHFAGELEQAGVDGMILFNRFYQPDIDPEELEVRRVNLSDRSELLLRLRWLAILSPQVKASLAAGGGVHDGLDAIKAIMAGADAVQMVATLLKNGPGKLAHVRDQMTKWLEEHEYDSLRQMQGSMNLSRCPNPENYERANYIQMLQSWS